MRHKKFQKYINFVRRCKTYCVQSISFTLIVTIA